MPTGQYMPQNLTDFAAWILTFYTQLQPLAEKYHVSIETIHSLKKDSDWAQYWAQARISAGNQARQLTTFIEGVREGAIGSPEPVLPDWSLPAGMPAAVAPGVVRRVREIVAGIKAQKSVYNQADGKLLGIVSPEEAGVTAADFMPALSIKTMPQYHLGVEYRKLGMDAVRIEFKRAGGEWTLLGDSAKSPVDFLVSPNAAGAPEQIELRAVFLKNYQPFGSYSPVYTATTAP